MTQQQQKHKAIQVECFSNDDPAAGCKVAMVSTPKPGAGQVLLKILCRPIHPSDILRIQGMYGDNPKKFPFVPGLEGMGVIEELGDGVTGFSPGQRVFHIFKEVGSWQEYAVASASEIIPIPDTISNEVAAQFFINPWTVYGMLETLDVPKGEYVLQTAAGSVLGRMFIQLARHRGVKTINLVRRDEQKEELKAIGGDEVINIKTEDVVEEVKKITGGKLVYGAVDAVGGALTKVVCSSVRNQGTILCYGVLDEKPEAQVGVSDLVFRQVKVHGFHVVKWVESFGSPDEFREIAATIFELIAKGVIAPLVGEKFPLDSTPEAIRKSLSIGRGGKVLLVSVK
ncbi:hypothetical protein SELMODRAFT_414975 [Selaginella moellendorffii]|uniref:Enoyl reductase (ER) domain-containing protein n=2 Tax=Selaginella moellendorffii TaxID=88036 RepID=D8RU70_SELML|nr:hypothetical protein SELMODRAFT_414975 [Selaginella moellendorffii]